MFFDVVVFYGLKDWRSIVKLNVDYNCFCKDECMVYDKTILQS